MSATGSFVLELEEGFDYLRRDWEGLSSREPVLDLSKGVIEIGEIGGFTVQPIPAKDYKVSREIAYWKVTRDIFREIGFYPVTWRRKTVEGVAKLIRAKW